MLGQFRKLIRALRRADKTQQQQRSYGYPPMPKPSPALNSLSYPHTRHVWPLPSPPRLKLAICTPALEVEWIQHAQSAPRQLSIRKRYGNGSVVNVYLNEDEARLLSQLTTPSREEQLTCAP